MKTYFKIIILDWILPKYGIILSDKQAIRPLRINTSLQFHFKLELGIMRKA